MSLTDAFRQKKRRVSPGADPAQAFGAAELTMEEIRAQSYERPEKKGPGFYARASGALAGLRQRITGDESPYPAHETNAPVYSAQTYGQESAPDLGWQNPFNEPSGTGAGLGGPTYAPSQSSVGYRFADEPMPEEPAPAYQEYGRQEESYSPPDSRSAYGENQTYAPQPETWEGGYTDYADYRRRTRYQEPPAQSYGPDFVQSFNENDGEGYDPYYEQAAGGEWYGPEDAPPIDRRPPRRKSDPGDLKYYFWSGSIVLSVFLTLFSFIYGCVV